MANTSSVRLQWTPEVGQWFEGKLDEELPPTPEEVQALKDYLIENTSQHNVSAAEAARRLMTVPHGQEAMSDVDAKSLRISDLIMDAQIEFEAQQPLMLDLIHNIEGFRESGDLVDARDATSHWRSARAWRFTPIEDETEEDVARKWTSMNALFANRCRRAFSLQKTAEQKAIGLGDAETIGIGCMTAALEQEPWRTRPENIPTDEKDKPSIMRKYKMAMLNVELPAAARWLQITGPDIQREIQRMVESPTPNAYDTTDLWKVDGEHPPGFSVQRWAFWKQRLRWITDEIDDADVLEETKREASVTLIAMEEYEKMSI